MLPTNIRRRLERALHNAERKRAGGVPPPYRRRAHLCRSLLRLGVAEDVARVAARQTRLIVERPLTSSKLWQVYNRSIMGYYDAR